MSMQNKLSSFIETSEQMLELAKAGKWEEVNALESDRRPELEAFFESLDESARSKNTEQLQQAIKRILSIDEEIMALGQAFKSNVVNTLQQNQTARKATEAYQKNNSL